MIKLECQICGASLTTTGITEIVAWEKSHFCTHTEEAS